jgi:hypothetical protein
VHHRIPNFVDAELAAQRLSQLPEFTSAKVIKGGWHLQVVVFCFVRVCLMPATTAFRLSNLCS